MPAPPRTVRPPGGPRTAPGRAAAECASARPSSPAQHRPAPQTPSRPLPDQPKAPRQPRSARPPKRMQEDEPGLELITRRPPKQKFANFEDYLAAHGGMTVPLPPEKTETPETAAPAAPAAE